MFRGYRKNQQGPARRAGGMRRPRWSQQQVPPPSTPHPGDPKWCGTPILVSCVREWEGGDEETSKSPTDKRPDLQRIWSFILEMWVRVEELRRAGRRGNETGVQKALSGSGAGWRQPGSGAGAGRGARPGSQAGDCRRRPGRRHSKPPS